MSASPPQNVPNLSSCPFSTDGGADPTGVEHIRNGPQRGRTSSLRLSDHRHDVGGKPIGLGLYAVHTRGLRSMPAAIGQPVSARPGAVQASLSGRSSASYTAQRRCTDMLERKMSCRLAELSEPRSAELSEARSVEWLGV
jgi:hypothetical protein